MATKKRKREVETKAPNETIRMCEEESFEGRSVAEEPRRPSKFRIEGNMCERRGVLSGKGRLATNQSKRECEWRLRKAKPSRWSCAHPFLRSQEGGEKHGAGAQGRGGVPEKEGEADELAVEKGSEKVALADPGGRDCAEVAHDPNLRTR